MIRKIEENDLQDMGKLLQQAYAAPPWGDTWKVEQAVAYLGELLAYPNSEGYVFVQEGNILGVCLGHYKTWYDGTHFVLEEFFMSTELQGIGIGSQIIEFLKGRLKEKEVAALELWTGKEFPAQKFYEKHGFSLQEDIAVMYCKINTLE